jgi:hypothetical protein
MNIIPPPILITGCARSGTSLIAGTINICGAFGGKMSGPNKNNAKGMFENAAIRNQIIKRYLLKMGLDMLGQFPLPDIENLKPYDSLQNDMEGIILKEGYQGGPWMYKGAKMCLIWPVMAEAFPDATWVIVRRKKEDIVASCVRTGFMRAFRTESFQAAVCAKNEYEGWGWWVDQHLKRFKEMNRAGLKIIEVSPERMVMGDYSEIIPAIEQLGLKWNCDALSFVDPRLWKSRRVING